MSARNEKILAARAARRQGFTAPEIGAVLGVSDSTVRNWWLGGDCETCGAPIEGSGRIKSRWCAPCNGRQQGRKQRGKGPVEAVVLEYLSEPRRFVEIREHLGTYNGYVAQILYRLHKHGLVVRVSHGVYRTAVRP